MATLVATLGGLSSAQRDARPSPLAESMQLDTRRWALVRSGHMCRVSSQSCLVQCGSWVCETFMSWISSPPSVPKCANKDVRVTLQAEHKSNYALSAAFDMTRGTSITDSRS